MKYSEYEISKWEEEGGTVLDFDRPAKEMFHGESPKYIPPKKLRFKSIDDPERSSAVSAGGWGEQNTGLSQERCKP